MLLFSHAYWPHLDMSRVVLTIVGNGPHIVKLTTCASTAIVWLIVRNGYRVIKLTSIGIASKYMDLSIILRVKSAELRIFKHPAPPLFMHIHSL